MKYYASAGLKTLSFFLVLPIAAHLLPKEEVGRFFFWLAVVQLGAGITTLGFSSTVARKAYNIQITDYTAGLGVIIALSLWLVVSVVGLATGLMSIAVAVAWIARSASMLGESRTVAHNRIGQLSAVYATYAVAFPSFCALLAAYVSATHVSLMLAYAIAEAIVAFVGLGRLRLRRRADIRLSGARLLDASRQSAKYGLPIMIAGIANLGLNSADRFIVTGFSGFDAVAEFSIMYTIAFASNRFITAPANLRLFPLYVRNRFDAKIVKRVQDAASLAWLASVAYCVAIATLGPRLIPQILGEAYRLESVGHVPAVHDKFSAPENPKQDKQYHVPVIRRPCHKYEYQPLARAPIWLSWRVAVYLHCLFVASDVDTRPVATRSCSGRLGRLRNERTCRTPCMGTYPMKVGLLGNYGHLNLGDEALLAGAIALVSDVADVRASDIVVLTDDVADTVRRQGESGVEVRRFKRPFQGRLSRLPLVIADIFRAFRGLDWLVFGGGGLINDSNRTAVPLFACACLLARLRGLKTAWFSVGIGPLQGKMHRRLARWMLASADFVTVRDKLSAGIAKELLGKDVRVAPDLAHALRRPGPLTTDKHVIAVSVIPYGKPGFWFDVNEERYAAYCAKMVALIRSLLELRPDIDVRLFPVSLKQDMAAIKDITEKGAFAAERRIEVVEVASLSDLFACFEDVSVVVATRLHSAVLATVAGIPLVSIAYQPKVASYVNELRAGYSCTDIESFSSEEVVEAVTSVLESDETMSEAARVLNTHRHDDLVESLSAWRDLL
jgi:polysaccharide pyruvyl transferase WcaK-like protein